MATPLPHVSSGDPHVAAHNSERDTINTVLTDMKKLMTKPNLPQVGAMLRYDGSEWVPSKTRLYEGAQQPEGIIAAPVGSRYIQTPAGTGAVEWLKTRGVDSNDNTGWTLLFADTGWRNIAGSGWNIGSGGAVNMAYLRRVNNSVDIYVDLKMPTSGASPRSPYTLPVGFRPGFTRSGGLQDNNETAASSATVTSSGLLSFYNPNSGKVDRWNGTWFTDDPWPTTLPGLPKT